MPGGLLIWSNGTNFLATVVNTDIEYVFSGAYPAGQLANVRTFARVMADNNPFAATQFLELGGENPDVVMRELFMDNNSMSWNFNLFWQGEEDDNIFDSMIEVGNLFLELLALEQSGQPGVESPKGESAI